MSYERDLFRFYRELSDSQLADRLDAIAGRADSRETTVVLEEASARLREDAELLDKEDVR